MIPIIPYSHYYWVGGPPNRYPKRCTDLFAAEAGGGGAPHRASDAGVLGLVLRHSSRVTNTYLVCHIIVIQSLPLA